MFRSILSIFFLCIMTFPQHQALAVDVKKSQWSGYFDLEYQWSSYFDPEYICIEEPFPRVYHFFGGKFALAKAIQQDPAIAKLYPKDVGLPEYLGYLVITEDFRFTFVNKSKRNVGIVAQVDALNAMEKESLYNTRKNPDDSSERQVPRWSSRGAAAIVRDMITQDVKPVLIYSSYGGPPDDDFVPEFSKNVRKITLDELKQLGKNGTLSIHWGLLNTPAGEFGKSSMFLDDK